MHTKSWKTAAARSTPRAPAESDQDAARAMDSLRRIVHALRVATRASERAFGVSAAQHFVLRQLSLVSGQSLSDLAARTRTAPSSVSEVVSGLVRRGLISRQASATDRRRAELSLTSAGAAILERAPETVQERLIAGFAKLGVAERRALAAGLESWLGASVLSDIEPVLFFEESDD